MATPPVTQGTASAVFLVDVAGNPVVSTIPLATDTVDRAARILGHVVVDEMPPGGSGLTDTELRASPVPMSLATAPTTPVTGTFWPGTQPVSAASLPLPAGAGTEATLAAIKAKTDNLDVLLSTRTKPADTQPVSGPITDGQLRATPVPISGTIAVSSAPTTAVTGPLTDTQLRATAVPISGTIAVSSAPTTAVTGPLTDAQIRATPLPVSGTIAVSSAPTTAVTGPVTDGQLRATPVPVSGTVTASGPVTDAQLRATPVPVSGTVTASGPLTDAQLRATPPAFQPVPKVQTVRDGLTAPVGAPAANAVITAGVAVAAGDYDIEVWLGSTGVAAVGKGMAIEHRNAANSANIWTVAFPTPVSQMFTIKRLTFALNERIRVVNGPTAGEASSRYSALTVMRVAT